MVVARRKNNVEPPYVTCPLGTCMALLSGAWTVHIIWYLGDGPRRFSELKSDLAGISSKVLSARLKKMEIDGVITRIEMKSSPPTVEYSLTKYGMKLKPAIESIMEVGHELKLTRKKINK